jgi:putative pantetheine hydrolase
VQRVDEGWLTGSTVVLTGAAGAVGGVDVRGGGPGTRRPTCWTRATTSSGCTRWLLTGGSAFGLAAADGVMARLAAAGVGYPVGPEPGQVVPIVPAAVVFDLGRGGDFTAAPDASFGGLAHDEAAGRVGMQRPVARLCRGGNRCGGGRSEGRGGVGQRGAAGRQHGRRAGGRERGRLDGRPRHGRAAGCAAPAARRGPGAAATVARTTWRPRSKLAAARPEPRPPLATTLVVLGTDLALSKAQCQKVAGLGSRRAGPGDQPGAHDVRRRHGVRCATGTRAAPGPLVFTPCWGAAADCVTRAVVHAMLAATTVETSAGAWRSYSDAFPSARS